MPRLPISGIDILSTSSKKLFIVFSPFSSLSTPMAYTGIGAENGNRETGGGGSRDSQGRRGKYNGYLSQRLHASDGSGGVREDGKGCQSVR